MQSPEFLGWELGAAFICEDCDLQWTRFKIERLVNVRSNEREVNASFPDRRLSLAVGGLTRRSRPFF